MIPNSVGVGTVAKEKLFDTWNLDKAKKAWLQSQIESMNLFEQMKNALWLTCNRLLYRLKASGQLGDCAGFVADAITSKKAVTAKSHDGGREGFFKKMKGAVFGKLNTSPNSLEKCDRLLEQLGAIRKHHNGAGLVAHTEVNIRTVTLLLELLHPQWDEIPQCFYWLKSVCDAILGRPFNRTDWENGDHVPCEDVEEMIEQYDQVHPLRAIAIEALDWLQQKAFYRFCVRKTKEYVEKFGVGCLVSDHWIDIGDPCDE